MDWLATQTQVPHILLPPQHTCIHLCIVSEDVRQNDQLALTETPPTCGAARLPTDKHSPGLRLVTYCGRNVLRFHDVNAPLC